MSIERRAGNPGAFMCPDKGKKSVLKQPQIEGRDLDRKGSEEIKNLRKDGHLDRMDPSDPG